MATEDDKSPETLGLSAEERARLMAEEQRKLDQLAQDVIHRYDLSRLGQLAIAGAGRVERLDDDMRRRMEARLGGSFADVRVVRGPFADRVTRRHGADAVTIGATGFILLRDAPRSNPRTAAGKALLAHELTHVRQAQSGLHFAHEKGQSGASGAAHEQEAEAVEESVFGESGAPPPQRDLAAFRERAIERTLEIVRERGRLDRDRDGFDDP